MPLDANSRAESAVRRSSRRRRSRVRRMVFRVAAVVCGLCGALAGAEIVFRVFDIRPPEPPPADQVDAFRVRNAVNELGLRHPAGFPPQRVPDEFRIAVLGDSMTYGEGVEAEDAFPAVMQRLLRRDVRPGRTWTVVNMGWLGDDTARERTRYERLADRIDADLLVLVFYVNDFTGQTGEPDVMLHRIYEIRDDRYLLSDVSYLFHYAERKIRLRLAYEETIRFYRADMVHGVEPEAFAPVAREIVALRDFAEARGTRFVLAMMPWLVRLDAYPLTAMHERLRRFCEEKGIPFCDLLPAFAGREGRRMRVSLANHHPSGKAHRIIARHLVQYLRRESLPGD